jgi:hypothetical protein
MIQPIYQEFKMRFQTPLLSCVALALLCVPLTNCSKKTVVEQHYVAPAGDTHQQQRNMHVVYSTVYHKNVVEYQNDSGAWFVAGMMIGGAWSPMYYPYSYWSPSYYNGWASQNQTNITYNNFGNTSAGTPVASGDADVNATTSGDPDSVVGTAAPSDDDYSSQGDVNVAPSSSSDDNSADGTPAATNSSGDDGDGTPAATSSSQGNDDGTPAATSSSQGNDDGTPAATSSSQGDDDNTPAATSSSQGNDDNTPAATSSSQGDDDGTPAATSSSQGDDDSGSSMGSSGGSDDSSSSGDSDSGSSSSGDDGD